MDPILSPYLLAADESERERHLEKLLLFNAAPEIRFTLRQRLGFHVSQKGINTQNQDAEDLYQEVMTKTVGTLRELNASSPIQIENFKQYVRRIAINECNNFLRNRSPARWRLKTNLREILTHQQEFALWKIDKRTLGGFAIWRGKERTEGWPPTQHSLQEDLEMFRFARFPSDNLKQCSLKTVLFEFFRWAGGPLELESLVAVIATLLNVKDVPVESLDKRDSAWIEAQIAASALRTSSRLEEQATLRQLWESISALPRNQRIAFCFRFESESGQGLLSLLLDSEIITTSQLAEEFDWSAKEMRELLLMVPMDPTTVAREMKATRQQVNKWYFRALEQLRKKSLPTNKSSR